MRVRLLPILMFALAGTVTVKAGSLFNAFDVSIGTASLAQGTEPAATPTATPAGEQKASTEPPAAADPAAQATTPPPADAAPVAATEGGAGVDGAEPMSTTTVSAEPGLSEQEVPDPFDYTDEEVDVLQQLAKRREELDLRARQLDEREALIQAAEKRMDQKMAELKALQGTVEDLLAKRSDEEEAELKSLVKMYENMKPKDAAQVFEEMDMDVLLDVVGRMSERKAAPIMALVTPTRAKEITFELAQRRALPMPQ